MPRLKSILLALLACATPTAACAPFRPAFAPQLSPPPLALEPCRLPILPEGPVTLADLEQTYLERGEAILDCDLKRRLAVEAFNS